MSEAEDEVGASSNGSLSRTVEFGPWNTLRCRREGPVAVLELNRPAELNVMNLEMRDELRDAFEGIRAAREIRALIITGAGEAFCAGGDVNDFVGRTAEDMHALMREKSHRWFRALWDLPIPSIAAVNGVAAGGGTNLLLACDLVIAADVARFGQTFQRVGLMPDLGGLFLLPRTIGLHRAKALCLTGEMISAERAKEFGIVYEVTSQVDLLGHTLALATRLASGPAAAYAASKSVLQRSFELSMEEVLHHELFAQSFLFSTEDHRARLTSFLKRDGGEGERDEP
jgi:2-(1,2-epoxy-1,2-dihydrophenyl)acetyl-CoA isomerase